MAFLRRRQAGPGCHATDKMNMKKIIGLAALFIAIGMLIMLLTHNRLVGLIIVALLLFVGYNCVCGD
ncbi:MAG: MFS transporter [Lachnospiraceae bacterium]|jgi:hypothetical protein|nr:MFS transporter [Lachnospiraceae bacterium]